MTPPRRAKRGGHEKVPYARQRILHAPYARGLGNLTRGLSILSVVIVRVCGRSSKHRSPGWDASALNLPGCGYWMPRMKRGMTTARLRMTVMVVRVRDLPYACGTFHSRAASKALRTASLLLPAHTASPTAMTI